MHTHARTHTHTHAHTRTHTHTHTQIHTKHGTFCPSDSLTSTRTHTYAYRHTRARASARTHRGSASHRHTHIYTRTHAHTHFLRSVILFPVERRAQNLVAYSLVKRCVVSEDVAMMLRRCSRDVCWCFTSRLFTLRGENTEIERGPIRGGGHVQNPRHSTVLLFFVHDVVFWRQAQTGGSSRLTLLCA